VPLRLLTAARPAASVVDVTTYRFLDGLGQVVTEAAFDAHADALAWAAGEDDLEEVQRVEYLGPEGDWRWAGPLLG
jgi:hypothetical protein